MNICQVVPLYFTTHSLVRVVLMWIQLAEVAQEGPGYIRHLPSVELLSQIILTVRFLFVGIIAFPRNIQFGLIQLKGF